MGHWETIRIKYQFKGFQAYSEEERWGFNVVREVRCNNKLDMRLWSYGLLQFPELIRILWNLQTVIVYYVSEVTGDFE
ncbi:unnamed protein product [Allacma fusca]|uniref:Uncharacterized protein n=1 Tax=Allacma fusca TaxID=39272 RepID=A0A8J2Q664_9HEXA|nr:unnamed protein product [Allacma fusca]